MCIGNGYTYLTNYDLISGHNPSTHITNSFRKAGKLNVDGLIYITEVCRDI